MKRIWIMFLAGAVILGGISGCRSAPDEAVAETKRETLAVHKTRAEFLGLKNHTCRGLTTLCPDQCGQSGSLAEFRIMEYIDFESFSEYGKKQESFSVLIENTLGEVLVPEAVRATILKLKAGDEVYLDWNHDYVTRNGASGPERPVIRLEPAP